MAEEIRPQTRKTLTFTHKQAGFSAASIAALTAVLVGPLSQVFQTKLDAAKVTTIQEVQATQILELKVLIGDSKREILDKITDSIKNIANTVDKHETRIVNLEFIQMNKTGGKK
mgnify:CR=1 FL=1